MITLTDWVFEKSFFISHVNTTMLSIGIKVIMCLIQRRETELGAKTVYLISDQFLPGLWFNEC